MVNVDMRITDHMNKLTRLETSHMREEVGQESIASDIEGHS